MPYVASLLIIPFIYLSILLFIGQQSLAVFGAALSAVVAYVVGKTMQRRGKVSLALMIFVLPALMASGCILFLQLAPFVSHHQNIISMRKVGLKVTTRPPDQLGEWLQNKSGTILPVWLVKLMGSECLSDIRRIEGELGVFQSIAYARIDVSKVYDVKFKQESQNSHVSLELVDWLNKNSNINHLHFDFSYFSEEDRLALSKLADNSEKQMTIRNCELVDELGSLHQWNWIHLIGESLSDKLARSISQPAPSRGLRLEVRHLSLGAITALMGYRGHVQIDGPLSIDAITAFARIGLESLELGALTSVPIVSIDNFENLPKTKYLRIINSHLDASECKTLAALFRCESLTLYNVHTKSIGRDQSSPVTLANPAPEPLLFSPELRKSFRELPDLTWVRFNGGDTVKLNEP